MTLTGTTLVLKIVIRRRCGSCREWRMSSVFASGKRALGVCDRCGFQFKLRELRAETVKLKRVNNLVCTACWSPDHPQLQVGMYPITHPQALHTPPPDTSFGPAGSRDIYWGWNPVGGASQFTIPLTPNTLAL